jgi:hypothetical protein
LAACLWCSLSSAGLRSLIEPCHSATHVVRSSTSTHSLSLDAILGTGPARLLPILHVVNRLIASSFYSRSNRTKACFILCMGEILVLLASLPHKLVSDHLTTDNNDFCRMAVERGSAEILVALVRAITPSVTHTGIDEDEPENLSRLREVLACSLHSKYA